MDIYECWENKNRTEISFLLANHPQHDFLTTDGDGKKMTHRYSIRAATHNEAMAEHHKAQGWEPYIPMEDS